MYLGWDGRISLDSRFLLQNVLINISYYRLSAYFFTMKTLIYII